MQKRNDADQILVLTSNRMMLDKSRYSADKIWNAFQRRPADDGAGNPTLAIEFGPTQYPAQHEVDNAEVFATALQDAQQDFGMRIRETDLQRLFIDLHVAAQVKSGIKSKNPKERAGTVCVPEATKRCSGMWACGGQGRLCGGDKTWVLGDKYTGKLLGRDHTLLALATSRSWATSGDQGQG